jgi:superfamily I DNA and/or RNA helicase
MSELSKVDIYRQIEVLRHNLLDLTMRNQLLNFRPRTMTVEVKEGDLAEIYDRLVLKKSKRKLLQFIPRTEYDETLNGPRNDVLESVNKTDDVEDVDSSESDASENPSEIEIGLNKTGPNGDRKIEKEINLTHNSSIHSESSEALSSEETATNNLLSSHETAPSNVLSSDENDLLWDSPQPDQETLEKNRELILPTNLTGSELQRRLFYINQRARSMMEEQGYNILYLAMGFLRWQDDNGNPEYREAPLILVPVELERRRVKGSFKLRWTGEDIIPNISLQAKLIEQGVEIPDFEMPRTKEGVTEYLDLVRKSVSLDTDWEIQNKIYLGFFSFTKFVMYKDLEPSSWPEDMPLEENPLIKEIFDPAEEELDPGFLENQVDSQLTSQDVYHVMDADSSQIAVIEDVKKGRDLVVEGPPGTGKSQTIVNLIAELLARGNTVLFVSEKMAALEVVKGRLDSVGLGEFCLELHSKKSNKKDVLEKLESVLRNPKPLDISLDNDLTTIEELKTDLNQYVNLLHSPYGKIGWTPYQIFGLKEKSLEHFEKSDHKMPRFPMEKVEDCSLKEWQQTVNKFKELGELYRLVKPVAHNPWRITQPDPILPAEEEHIQNLLTSSLQILNTLKSKAQELSKKSGVKIPTTLEETEHLIAAVEIISSFPSLERDLIMNPSWDYDKLKVYQLIKSLEEYKSITKDLDRFNKSALEVDIPALLKEFQGQKKKILKFLSSDFKKLKKKIGKVYVGTPPDDDEKILKDLEELKRCRELQEEIRNQNEKARALFGSHWKAEKSQATNLKNISEWILKFRKALKEGRIDEKTLIILDSINQKELKHITQKLHQDYDNLLNSMKNLDQFLHFKVESILGKGITKCQLEELDGQIQQLKDEMRGLQNWSRYSSSRAECLETIGSKLVDIMDQDEIESLDLIPCLEGNFADSILRKLFLNEPLLSRFVGDVHLKRIEEFKELDDKIIKLNRFRIAEKLYDKRPSLSSNASPRSELGVLKSEFSRKRGHMPIRKLLSICGGLIQTINPCFMMSPLSIAQYLEPYSVKNHRFDYVIFDEASQVKPEDALGALLRAKYAVIMGDTRQLPPTTFFDILIDVESEDYDLAVLADMESILHLTKRSFPSKMLRWHYRSRHESLIAVSNQEFYDNHLLVYPSPSQDAEELGLKLIHLPDTVYDRGKTATNHEEAKQVIKTVFVHYQKYGDAKSLGVGTFNVRQQQAILEELELQLKLHPKMEKYFNRNQEEHFFVKNLETIQGDERDVILVSVGYGFDSTGRLSQNFGPVNQDGGERRLNVLMTRAREKCIIFSNFRGRDLKLSSNSPFGLRALKVFLEYAENKNLKQPDKFPKSNETAFEEAILEFLSKKGYEVHSQVGCAGFRVDLAVVDPEFPERYLLGITCDGPIYQSSRVARDRDRLRQQILKGLGWNLYQLWSPDWYRNRAEIQKRLLEHIEELLDEERAELEFIPPVGDEDQIIQDSIKESEDETAPSRMDVEVLRSEITLTPSNDEKEKNESPASEFDVLENEINIETNTPSVDGIPSRIENSLEELASYHLCNLDENFQTSEELHNQPVGDVARAVICVVQDEGPIHYDEVVKRIRIHWGLSRAGRRVQTIMKKAVELALQDGQIIRKGDFLYYKDAPIMVRRRTGKQKVNMELISQEEIAEAVIMVLKSQYATLPDDLVREVVKLFGAKIARGPATRRINGVITDLINQEQMEKRPDGMVDLVRN